MERDKLMPIEWNNQRIMTTKTLAECYETKEHNINKNFNEHQDRFEEGKHYYTLKGEDLKEFKRVITNSDYPLKDIKFASVLTLWTERGALRHAKILDTDVAWEVYEQLEDTYFKVREMKNTKKIPQTFAEALQLAADIEKERERLELENKENKPKVEFYDVVVDSKDLLNMKAVADLLNIKGLGRNNLYKLLRERNILNKRNEPYRDFINKGYFEVKESKYILGDEVKVATTTYVTQKGVDFIRKLVKDR